MVTAYILIQTEVGKAAQVAKDIIDITGVQQAQAVTGPYDVIVRAEGPQHRRTRPAQWYTSSAARSPSGFRPTAAATEI